MNIFFSAGLLLRDSSLFLEKEPGTKRIEEKPPLTHNSAVKVTIKPLGKTQCTMQRNKSGVPKPEQ